MGDLGFQPGWKIYERIVAVLEAENAWCDMSATLNAPVMGVISGVERQVDLLLDARWSDDLSRRMIVDAKRYNRKINVKDVESFEGMMRDCQAHHGFLVCPRGWSEGALRRAQDAITIKLFTLEDVEKRTDWAVFEPCHGRCFRRPEASKRGVVWWDGQLLLNVGGLWAVIFTGKCDGCHAFHVWCWGCGEILSLDAEDNHECFCGILWSTLAEGGAEHPAMAVQNTQYLTALIGDHVVSLERRHLPCRFFSDWRGASEKKQKRDI